ncbi:response regulator transcription factor [Nocardioides KLBMP 9356]|uniref:Response regulator transcription factor n=1 Tax=Nocardioides potassii TaxID=2911371 RepID=A0ABS9H9E0_9ACTN|nr:response regulator transcription factor [Nocardioides potassii]MCF6376846.1 response regulator transcription factor [Nocardioides potassii]
MISVLLVDDDPLVRSALALMLGGQSDIEVVGEAPNGQEGVALVGELDPDVVLMDIRMPVMDGLEATQVLHQQPAPPAVVVLTTFDADDHVVRAVAAGADGFLLKDTPPGDIVHAIRTVAAGDAMLSPSATRSIVARLRSATSTDRSAAAADRLTVLTERELEVAVAVGRGLSNSEIASELYLSVPTVKSHVSRLLTKLESTNRVQVAMVVHDAGLV